MSSINPNDLRRYRMRSTGIVYRVIGERHDEMDLAPVCGGVALEIKREGAQGEGRVDGHRHQHRRGTRGRR